MRVKNHSPPSVMNIYWMILDDFGFYSQTNFEQTRRKRIQQSGQPIAPTM
jgi:hypothetical protein